MIFSAKYLVFLTLFLSNFVIISSHDTSTLNSSPKSSFRNYQLEEKTRELIQLSDRRKLETLSDDCLNKMCQMVEAFFTCEVFDVQWEKVCAKYILGYLYSCPIYPAPSKITEAPSICLDEIIELKNGPPDIKEIATEPTRGEDCYVNCYQTYLERSIDFWTQCGADVDVIEYPILDNLGVLETYREQACSYDRSNNDSNCVDLILQLAPAPSPSPAPTMPPTPDLLFSYTCLPSPAPYMQLCAALLAPMGCCMANQVAILTSINQTLAPCTMDYISKSCPTNVDLSTFCPNGTFTDLGTIQAYIKLNFGTSTPQTLPKMNSYDGYIYFRAVVTKLLGLSPLQVVVLSYTYYNGTTSLGQKINGATNAEFRYQIMISGTSESSYQTILNTMRTPVYPGSIAAGYGKTPTVVTQFTIEKTEYYVADPIVIPKNDGSLMKPSLYMTTSLFCGIMAIIVLVL